MDSIKFKKSRTTEKVKEFINVNCFKIVGVLSIIVLILVFLKVVKLN